MSILDDENKLIQNTDINTYIAKLKDRIKKLEEEVEFLKYGDHDSMINLYRGRSYGFSELVDIYKKRQ